MDLHPTPFPGKRRPAWNTTVKDADRSKPSKNPPPPLTAATSRPKRAFGVPRSTNIPTEKPKPLSTKSTKPWKPSGTLAARAGRNDAPLPAAEKAPENVSGSGSGKAKAFYKKSRRVGFQDLPVVPGEINQQEDVVQTPVHSTEPAVAGTPYLSAQNCSNCRLDRLESASYWLSQIKLAESVGKHFVSAAFFRLALDCHAQPFYRLQSELKHYVLRHGAIAMDALWKDLYTAFGLSDDTDTSNLNEIDDALVEQEIIECNNHNETACKTQKDGNFESNESDTPHRDLSVEEPPLEHVIDICTCELKENIDMNEPAELKRTPSSASNVSVKKAHGEKSNRVSTLFSNDSSSNSKAQKPSGSGSKGYGSSNQSRKQPVSRMTSGNLSSRNGASPKMNQGSELRSQQELDEKVTRKDLIRNLKS